MVYEYLKLLGSDNRSSIITAVNVCPLNVNELSCITKIEQTNLSRHLKKLQNKEIIKFTRIGKYKYYYVNEQLFHKYDFMISIINKMHEEFMHNGNCEDFLKIIDRDEAAKRNKLLKK